MLVTEPPQPKLSTNLSTAVAETPQSDASPNALSHPADFPSRHIGPDPSQTAGMLDLLGYPTLDALIDKAVPAQIRLNRPLSLPAAKSEYEVLGTLKEIASQNQVYRSFIGMGYYDCITPALI